MDKIIKSEQTRNGAGFWSLQAIRRRWPVNWPVQLIGYIRNKTGRQEVYTSFAELSLILRGNGHLKTSGGKILTIEAPCAFFKPVNQPVILIPDSPWEEWLFRFPPALLQTLRQTEPEEDACHHRRLQPQMERVYPYLQMVRILLERPELNACIDEIDRLAELILVTVLTGIPPMQQDHGVQEKILAVREILNTRFRQALQPDQIAAELGLAQATFRRYWQQIVGIPPGQYLSELRIRYAARLLVESDRDIGEIAQEAGFRDRLYFSRKFRMVMGLAPRTYREVHQVR